MSDKNVKRAVLFMYLNTVIWSLIESSLIFLLLWQSIVLPLDISILCAVFCIDYIEFRRRRHDAYSVRKGVTLTKRDIMDCESGYTQYDDICQKRYFVMIARRIHWIGEMLDGASGYVLDVGCGCGDSTIPLTRKNRTLVGLDISVNMLHTMREKHPSATSIAGDAEYLPFKPKTFSGIVLGEILEHLLTPQKALSECVRVLREDGILVITTPTAAKMFPTINPLIWLNQIVGVWNRKMAGTRPTVVKHPNGKLFYHTDFTRNELEKLLKTNGVTINLISTDSPRWVFRAFELLPINIYKSFIPKFEGLFRQLPLLRYLGDS